MSKIRIKNFGPIKEGFQENDGWIDIKKVTVFIGNQGSGKSTLAKVISTLTWIEKAFYRGDLLKPSFSRQLFVDFFHYQRIHNYFLPDTILEYVGEKISIFFNGRQENVVVEYSNTGTYTVPKIMYVPSERNFLSSVENAFNIKSLPEALHTFAVELRKGQSVLENRLLDLPIGNLKYHYNEYQDASYLYGPNFELNLTESSSGYQSFIPLFLVTKFLSDELLNKENSLNEQLSVEQSVRRRKEIIDLINNEELSESERDKRIREVNSKYLNSCLINIVEEPEQNLFPDSQRKIINSLVGFNNYRKADKLIITTHSPYLINYLTLAVKAERISEKLQSGLASNSAWIKLNKIVPMNSIIKGSDLAIYEIDDYGNVIKLPDYNGLPSDDNYLNNKLAEGNELFSQLLEIQQSL